MTTTATTIQTGKRLTHADRVGGFDSTISACTQGVLTYVVRNLPCVSHFVQCLIDLLWPLMAWPPMIGFPMASRPTCLAFWTFSCGCFASYGLLWLGRLSYSMPMGSQIVLAFRWSSLCCKELSAVAAGPPVAWPPMTSRSTGPARPILSWWLLGLLWLPLHYPCVPHLFQGCCLAFHGLAS